MINVDGHSWTIKMINVDGQLDNKDDKCRWS